MGARAHDVPSRTVVGTGKDATVFANIRSLGSALAVATLMSMLMLRFVADTSAQLASDAQSLDEVTGTYLEALPPAGCEARAAVDATRAVTVLYSRGALSLRASPGNAIRTLRLQRRRMPINVAPIDGVARWQGQDIVVRSVAPALPLWSTLAPTKGARALVETFSFSKTSLTYRVSYQNDVGTNQATPYDLVLRKCDIPDLN